MLKRLWVAFAVMRAVLDAILCMTLIPKPFDVGLIIFFITGIGLGHNLTLARNNKREYVTKRICIAIEFSFALALIPKMVGCNICYGGVQILGTAITVDLVFAGLLTLFMAGITLVGWDGSPSHIPPDN